MRHWTTKSPLILLSIQVKHRKTNEEGSWLTPLTPYSSILLSGTAPQNTVISEYNWDVVDEYDPMWPNEYEKLVKDKRDRNKERDEKRRDSNVTPKRRRKSDDSPKFSGFAGRPSSDDEDNTK